jgi:hypothetical protein
MPPAVSQRGCGGGIHIQTNAFDSDGRGVGGVVNVVTKSGSNFKS